MPSTKINKLAAKFQASNGTHSKEVIIVAFPFLRKKRHLLMIYVEPCDDDKTQIDDEMYRNSEVNYDSKAFINDF
eukprot:8995676-Ditylum_brightwellii.AAC.1